MQFMPPFPRSARMCLTSSVLIAALLFQTACGATQVTTSLDLIVTAATIAINTLEATGVVSPAEGALILTYLGEVSTGVSFANTELNSTDASAVKATKIIQEFGMIVIPALPPGTAATVVLAVQQVADAIVAFLANLEPAAASVGTRSARQFNYVLTKGDIKELGKVEKDNAVLHNRLSALGAYRH